MVRTFIGIEIESSVVSEISQELSYLTAQFPNINWVKPKNLHITLKYLGNVEPNDLRKIFDLAGKLGKIIAPFSLGIVSAGVLPDLRHPKVVYAGCGCGCDEIITMQRLLEENCHILGYARSEKVFTPHITLGRIKKAAFALGIAEIIQDMHDLDFGITDVAKLTVYMSELNSDGAEYSPMFSARLDG